MGGIEKTAISPLVPATSDPTSTVEAPQKTDVPEQTPPNPAREPETPPPPAYQKPPFELLQKKNVRWDPKANAMEIRSLQKQGKTGELFRSLRLGALAKGEPFDPKLAAAIEKICGAPISKAALTSLYESCLPNTRVRLSAFASEQTGTLEFTVTWIDNASDAIATLRRKLKRHDDGSLELYSHGCWVDAEHRGKAVSARVMQQEVTLLKTLSHHPATRLSLWAGGVANPKNRSEQQNIGIYAWACFGFELAGQHGLKTKLGFNTDRARCEGDVKEMSDLDTLKKQFALFVASLGLENQELASALVDASKHWKKPWEVASLRVKGLRLEVPVGKDRKVPCDIGKAFLLSKFAPRWEGAYLVNHPRSPSAKLAASYITRSIDAAETQRQEREATWLHELHSRYTGRREKAIERIGLDGGPEWIEKLEALASEKPQHAELIQTAIARIKHEWKPPAPKYEYSYSMNYTSGPRPLEVPREYAEIAALEIPQIIEKIRGEDFRKAEAALIVLFDKDPVAVRPEARAFIEKWTHEDRWQQRRTAVDVLGRLPSEAGIPDLVELWSKEDDINTMIAYQRWLDPAENPIAEKPAHDLGVKIEEMKEEIRKALEELANG